MARNRRHAQAECQSNGLKFQVTTLHRLDAAAIMWSRRNKQSRTVQVTLIPAQVGSVRRMAWTLWIKWKSASPWYPHKLRSWPRQRRTQRAHPPDL